MEQERASNDQLWFEWPRSERLSSARRWMDVPLSRLALSARPYNALMRSRFYASVGDLMLAGDEVRLVRNLGELSLRQIHDVLAPELALAVPEKTVEADGSGLGVAHAQYDSLRVLATMGTYSVDPWHGIRPMLRSAAAAAFRGCATARLPIDRQTAEAVAAVRRFGTVAALIEGDETALCREFPVDVRQQIHEALRSASLRYFEATFILPELTLALDQLRLREDLWSLNLNHLAWSDDLRALAAGLFADTLGDLCQHSSERIAATACHDAGLLGGLVDELRTTVNMPPGAEGVDWARLWRDRGVRVFPDPDGPWVVAEAASELLGLHLSERLSDRHAEVLRHRLGLDGAEVYTLEELGGVYGVTRERIRQIETKAKSVSGRFLSDVESWPEVVAPAQLDPGLLEAWHDLLETVRECANAPMPERELRDRSNRVLRTESEEVHPLVGLVAAAGRVRRSSARYGAGSVWHHQSRSVGALLRRMEAVSRFLTTVTARSYSPLELTVHMNRASGSGDRLTVEDVQEALGLCELVERLDDGRYQGRFEHLRPRLLRAERVLREAAQPLHLAHIAREINHRVTPLGLRRVKVPSLSNQMASDDRYVPIGRSGYWALSEWPDIETGTVLELMERCFVEENTALSSRAIYEYVSGRRPVSFNSILLYLSGDDRFAPLEGDMWVLSSWPESKRAERWNRRGLADFVGRYFAQRGQERVPLDELVSVVSGSARISEDVAREMLLVSPALEIVEDDQGILTAVYVSGYRKALEDPVGKPRVRMHRYELLARRTVEELERRPSGEMPLSELRELLTKELDIPDPTFYAYIARVDAIETLPWPGHAGKRIRLVDRAE